MTRQAGWLTRQIDQGAWSGELDFCPMSFFHVHIHNTYNVGQNCWADSAWQIRPANPGIELASENPQKYQL